MTAGAEHANELVPELRRKLATPSVSLLLLFSFVLSAHGLINPTYTPVDLVKQSQAIVHVNLQFGTNRAVMQPAAIRFLKGKETGLDGVAVPFHLRSDFLDPDGKENVAAVLFSGDYRARKPEEAGAGRMAFLLQTDVGWYGVYEREGAYTLGEDPMDMQAVWAGSAKMLLGAIDYILSNPRRASIPVSVGVQWEGVKSHDTNLREATSLLPAIMPDGRRLFLATSPHGDNLYTVDKACNIMDVTSEFNLKSRSTRAAWCDLTGNARLDLLSWTGADYQLFTNPDGAYGMTASATENPVVYSLCASTPKPGGKGTVIAGTSEGPQVVSFSEAAQAMSVVPVRDKAEKASGGACTIADYTGNGHHDIMEVTASHLLLYQGVGDGVFLRPIEVAETYGLSLLLEPMVLDMNADGLLDLIAIGADGAEPYLNLGNGAFRNIRKGSGALEYVGRPGVIAASTADFNGDGRQEFILFYESQGPLAFFNRGFACFGYATELELRETGIPMAESIMRGQQTGIVADMNADGKQETIVVTSTGDLVLLRTTSSGPALSVQAMAGDNMALPCTITATANAQLLGARNMTAVFPVFWGVERKGPIDISYTDSQGERRTVREVVIRPLQIEIGTTE